MSIWLHEYSYAIFYYSKLSSYQWKWVFFNSRIGGFFLISLHQGRHITWLGLTLTGIIWHLRKDLRWVWLIKGLTQMNIWVYCNNWDGKESRILVLKWSTFMNIKKFSQFSRKSSTEKMVYMKIGKRIHIGI